MLEKSAVGKRLTRKIIGAKKLGLGTFVARREGAGVPHFIVGVDRAEPPTTDAAVDGCLGIARLVHGRNGLTRPLEVPGFCLIQLLQHVPTSCGAPCKVLRLFSARE